VKNIAFLVLVFGFLVNFRTLTWIFSENYFEKTLQRRFFVAFVFIFPTSWLFFSIFISHFLIFLLIWALILLCVSLILKNRAQKRWFFELELFLERLIFQIHAGFSLRNAMERACLSSSDKKWQKKLQDIHKSVVFSQQNYAASEIERIIIEDLRHIDRLNHKNMQRVQSLRKMIKMLLQLRRKSELICLKPRLQSILMLGIYGFASYFVFKSFPISQFQTLWLLSFFLFCIGGVWVWREGRSIQWKM